MSKKDFVKPPQQDNKNDYVKPPNKSPEEDYVKPPNKTPSEDYIKPPNKTPGEDYVKPPKKTPKEDYVKPPNKKQVEKEGKSPTSFEIQDSLDSYFSTPKVGFKFYVNGYSIMMLLHFILTISANSLFANVIGFAYILLTSYTYSWFADYKRYVGGSFSWFFVPYGGGKLGLASVQFMDYRTANTSVNYWGNYTTRGSRDIGRSFASFMIILIVVEALKFFIKVPIAFITIFTHKRTIQKYRAAVKNNN